jgi:hypothetical protein
MVMVFPFNDKASQENAVSQANFCTDWECLFVNPQDRSFLYSYSTVTDLAKFLG